MTVKVKYRCTHITCRNPICYESVLGERTLLKKETFEALKEAETESSHMRSPAGACKIGVPQVFEILEVEDLDERSLSSEEVIALCEKKIVETKRVKNQLVKQKLAVEEQLKQAEMNLIELNQKLEKAKQAGG